MKFVEIDYIIEVENEPKCCNKTLKFFKLDDVGDEYEHIIVSYCENCKTKGFYEQKTNYKK